MTPRELETLIHRHLDGIASAEEVEALSQELERDQDSRVLYLQLAELHAVLAVCDEPAGDVAPASEVQPAWRGTANGLRSAPASHWLWWSGLVAAVMAAVLLGPWGLRRAQEPEVPDGLELATLTGALGLQPSRPETAALRPGQKLSAGRLSLSAGVAEITLYNGVQILFEGPGELELLTPMRAVLHAGQAVLHVPNGARGFQLETPAANVADLGTEFAVKAGPGLSTEILVYDGVVVTTANASGAAGTFPQRLTAGNAVRFAADTRFQPAPVAYTPERFVRRLPSDRPIEHGSGESWQFNRTRFEELVIPRPKPAIVVDGDLSEWSDEGRFRSERQDADDSGYYVEGRMRHDTEFIYIGAHIGDPAPLRNVVDPATDGELGWRGGGLQVRLSSDRALGWPVDANAGVYYTFRRLTADAAQIAKATNDRLAHLTLWQHAPSGQGCLHIAFGMDFHGGVSNPAGYRGRFRADADGRGYTLEYAIRWSLLHAGADPPQPGDTLGVSWTAHWSDPSGRLWRGQHVELRNADEPLRIHTWERAATWGRAVYR